MILLDTHTLLWKMVNFMGRFFVPKSLGSERTRKTVPLRFSPVLELVNAGVTFWNVPLDLYWKRW